MKYSIGIFFLLFSAVSLYGQAPVINYMIVDEAKSQLQIQGTFSSDTSGFVTIQNTKQTVRSWSDTLIICDLPDSGAGSGGQVTVTQMSKTSNMRMLSIFKIDISHTLWTYQGPAGFLKTAECIWFANWRADIEFRESNEPQVIPFEISKVSFGSVYGLVTNGYEFLRWADTVKLTDSSISIHGLIYLTDPHIAFYPALMEAVLNGNPPSTISYQVLALPFDTTGIIEGYVDSVGFSDHGTRKTDSVYNAKILFPPKTKNAVSILGHPASDLIKIFTPADAKDHKILLVAEQALGEIKGSLYSIDGRLLRQENFFITSQGKYSFDASGFDEKFGILTLQTSNEIVVKKVFF